MFGTDTTAARFSRTRSPALVQDCVVRGASSSLCTMRDGQQRQVKVDTVVSCFIRINLQNWLSCVEMAVGCGVHVCKYMIVRTICLNKALFHVSLTCIYLLS